MKMKGLNKSFNGLDKAWHCRHVMRHISHIDATTAYVVCSMLKDLQ